MGNLEDFLTMSALPRGVTREILSIFSYARHLFHRSINAVQRERSKLIAPPSKAANKTEPKRKSLTSVHMHRGPTSKPDTAANIAEVSAMIFAWLRLIKRVRHEKLSTIIEPTVGANNQIKFSTLSVYFTKWDTPG